MQSNQIRTTIYLDEELYLAAKKKALEKRTTVTSLIRAGLKSQIYNLKEKNSNKNDILSLYGAFKTKKRIPFKKVREAFGDYMARRHLKALK